MFDGAQTTRHRNRTLLPCHTIRTLQSTSPGYHSGRSPCAVNDAAQARELLSAPQFFAMIRDVVRFRVQPAVTDALRSAVDQIKLNPAIAQSRLLMRVLAAIPTQSGEFRRAEAAVLDAPTVALVIALMDMHATASRSAQDWAHAIDEANAASA